MIRYQPQRNSDGKNKHVDGLPWPRGQSIDNPLEKKRELTHLYFSTFCSATTLFKVLYFTKKMTFW